MVQATEPQKPATPVADYFKNIWGALSTTVAGMKITGRYFFQKPVTIQYPDEQMPIPDRYRGIHYLEQDKCIECHLSLIHI